LNVTSDGVLSRLKEPGFTDLCGNHSVDLAVIFGSMAKRRATTASDVDLAVSLSSFTSMDDEDKATSSKVALMRALMDYLETSRVHLVILNRADPLLKFEVARGGTPVYERREGAFADFCSLALRQHEDSRVLYDAMDRYLAKSVERGAVQ